MPRNRNPPEVRPFQPQPPETPWPPDWRFQFLLPVGLSVLAALVRYALEPWLHGRLPFIAMVPVVLASVWYGGRVAGLLAIVIGGAFGDWISSQRLPWSTSYIDHGFALASYLISMLIVVFLVDRVRRAERDILALNARLQRAMAETHHRVKNNLQVVSALVEMPTLSGQSSVAVDDLRAIGQHIRGLAAIHDLLTDEAKASGGVEYIGSKDVLDRLARLFDGMATGRAVECQAVNVPLPARQATALSVVVNELVNNALKHGRGDVRLRFSAEDGRAALDVSDGGAGFPEAFDADDSANTGLELVQSVATWDLGGQVAYDNMAEGGARVVVTFPVQSSAA